MTCLKTMDLRARMTMTAALLFAMTALPGCRPASRDGPRAAAPLPPGIKQMTLVVTRNRMVDGESKTDRVETID